MVGLQGSGIWNLEIDTDFKKLKTAVREPSIIIITRAGSLESDFSII